MNQEEIFRASLALTKRLETPDAGPWTAEEATALLGLTRTCLRTLADPRAAKHLTEVVALFTETLTDRAQHVFGVTVLIDVPINQSAAVILMRHLANVWESRRYPGGEVPVQ